MLIISRLEVVGIIMYMKYTLFKEKSLYLLY